MTDLRGPWDASDLEAFLASVTVPLRLACRTPAGRLWLVPLWFTYEEGRFHCATSREADLVEFLEADAGVALDVSTNEPPYRGVRGNGTARIEPDPEKELLRDLLDRYLGGTESPLAEQLLDEKRREVRIVVDPDRLVTWDYTARMSGG